MHSEVEKGYIQTETQISKAEVIVGAMKPQIVKV